MARSIERRLEALEARIGPRASTGERPPWYTPEAWAERERRFAALFAELDALFAEAGMVRAPPPGDREQAYENLFAVLGAAKGETDRRE